MVQIRVPKPTETKVELPPDEKKVNSPKIIIRTPIIVKKSNNLCIHGKAKNGYYCRECPGKGICEHGKRGYLCKKCPPKNPEDKTQKFIEECKLIHNDKFDYSAVIYQKSKKKVIIKCKIHGEFLQKPSDHKSGQGCPGCAVVKRANNRRITNEKFIKESRKVHGFDTYNYDLVNYKGRDIKVIIKCKIHGEFQQGPDDHKRGAGCPKCGKCGKRSNTEEFITESNLIHRNRYDYSRVKYTLSAEKVIIICKEHGEFLQTPNSHKLGQGCPLCGKKFNKREELCRTIFQEHYQKEFPKARPIFLKNPETNYVLELDGYNEELAIAFEHNGQQHFHYVPIFHQEESDLLDQMERDKIKVQKCKENGINLIVIPYSIPEKGIKDFILSKLNV